MLTRSLLFSVLVLISAALPAAARAEAPEPLVTVGAGTSVLLSAGDPALVALAVDAAFGVRLSPKLAILFDTSYHYHATGVTSSRVSQLGETMALQLWPLPRLWTRFGIGVGWVEATDGDGDGHHRTGAAPLLSAAAGVSLSRRLELQLRGEALRHFGQTLSGNASLLLSVSL